MFNFFVQPPRLNILILEGCGKLWLRYFILWYNGHIKWEDVDNYVDSVDNPLFG